VEVDNLLYEYNDEYMQIYSGSSNRGLAKKIAELMGTKLGQIEISQFAGGETRIWVKERKIEKEVVVIQSLSTPTNENLVEFCLICDGLHRAGASEITAVIPWMGYSKQDKVFRPGEPLSCKVVAQIIQTAHLSKIVTIDLHNRATLGFFDTPIVELSAKSLLVEYFRKLINESHGRIHGFAPTEHGRIHGFAPTENHYLVVAPDAGAVKASAAFANELGIPIVYMDKKRDLDTGEVKVVGMNGSVVGKDVLLIDDNVFTGATLLETAKVLKESGAKSIRVGLTHHLYIKGVQEKIEESEIDEIVVTDTVSMVNGQWSMVGGKLKILSVAGLIESILIE